MNRKLHQLKRSLIGRSAEIFNEPEPSYIFEYENLIGDKVGQLEGGMSPAGDTFFLFQIEVPIEYRRQYYGLSMLADICKAYKVPVTVIHATNQAFWNKVKTCGNPEVRLHALIKLNEMDAFRKRWSDAPFI